MFEQDKPATHFFIVQSGSVTVEIPSIDGEPLSHPEARQRQHARLVWLIAYPIAGPSTPAPPRRQRDRRGWRAPAYGVRSRLQLGYELLKRFAVLMAERLNAARRAAIRHYAGA